MEITESLFPGAEVHPLGKMMHCLQGLSEALPSGHVSTGLLPPELDTGLVGGGGVCIQAGLGREKSLRVSTLEGCVPGAACMCAGHASIRPSV